jgi:molecular chaperone DnaK (HSP70)
VKLHSIELLGGASRIPALRGLVGEVFGSEPSKTLNQSEAMVHGTAIFGAK